ncbi:F-box only protein 21-like [Babylonia areolata]|uniref:F-box only protein 21-like n=1 Tax=Babylonia areolata TaxID=304850 RepID=UPI003FD58868
MPVNRQAVLQLSLLLLAVPAQYFITHLISSSDSSSRNLAFRRLVNSAAGFRSKYLSLAAWSQWCQDLLSLFSPAGSHHFHGHDDPNGESPAVEVLRYKDKWGYFASSPEPRSPRPSNVKFHVGQVIRHKRWKYRGVIIGWDPKAKAPEDWLRMNHPSNKKHWRDMPNYSILVDTRDRLAPQITYVPQENIEVIDKTQVMHPSLDNYFEHYDGAQYITRPWLQAVYPQD